MGKNFFPYLWLSNKAVRIVGIVGKGSSVGSSFLAMDPSDYARGKK